jgi:hypothetical protein
MKTRLSLTTVFGILRSIAIVLLVSAPVHAQWVKIPGGAIPRSSDGKPNLSTPAPRLADGQPDLSGIWEAGSNKYVLNIAADLSSARHRAFQADGLRAFGHSNYD